MTGFWNITASNLLTIGVLVVYWWISRAYCLDEINSCYARLSNCTAEKFPNASLINFNASQIYSFPLNASAINAPSNVTR